MVYQTYGKDNFFLEIKIMASQRRQKAKRMLKLSKEYGLGIVASNDFHYVLKEMQTRKILGIVFLQAVVVLR